MTKKIWVAQIDKGIRTAGNGIALLAAVHHAYIDGYPALIVGELFYGNNLVCQLEVG